VSIGIGWSSRARGCGHTVVAVELPVAGNISKVQKIKIRTCVHERDIVSCSLALRCCVLVKKSMCNGHMIPFNTKK
jgi:hypothetical protein